MSAGKQPEGVVKLDVESCLQTMEGRIFIKHLNQVSHVLSLRDTELEFKGEELVKTGYVGDCKSVMLFKCPKGYFLFCDKAFGKNNWSVIGDTVEAVLEQVNNQEVKEKLQEEISAAAAEAA